MGDLHEGFLLALLNSTQVVDGHPADELGDDSRARTWLAKFGGTGTAVELRAVRETRASLQAVVRGEQSPVTLEQSLRDVSRMPVITEDGITWMLNVEPQRALSARAVLTWGELAERSPGRLRPCANDECHLFLFDRSKANSARWCSMATCGNRMKARRHYRRQSV
jgi:predicted RNA-binding Zn ribbon-like protein